MSIDAGPGIIDSLFGKTTLKPVEKSGPLGRQIDTTIGRQNAFNAAQDLSLADYANQIKGITGQVKGLADQNLGIYSNLINQRANFDPTAQYKTLGDYLTGLWGNAAGKIAGIDRGATNLNLANLGYGGQGQRSKYADNILYNNISQNLAPAWMAALNNITPAYQATNAATEQQLGDITNLMGQRLQQPLAPAQVSLLPAQARAQFNTNEIGNLSGLGGAVNQNLAGFQSNNNAVRGAMNAVQQSENQAQDMAVQAAAMYFGGGMGGGGGGMGGIGRNQPLPQQNPFYPSPQSYNPWYNQYYNQYPTPQIMSPWGSGGYYDQGPRIS